MKKIAFLLLSISLIIGSSTYAQNELKDITLEDIWLKYKFFPKSVRGINSLQSGDQYTMIKNGSVIVYDYKTGDSITTLVHTNDLVIEGKTDPITLSSFSMNKEETKFLIPTETEAIYRHSSKSVYYIWDSESKILELLSSGKQQLAEFSPNGKYVAFVKNNNIYIKDIISKKEIAIAQETGFPPKELKNSAPLLKDSSISLVQITAPIGCPFAIGLPIITISGTTS